MFVLARTLRIVRALKTSSDFDPKNDAIASSYNNAGNSASFEKKFVDCWEVLQAHAQLTELGKGLMYSSREMAFGS